MRKNEESLSRNDMIRREFEKLGGRIGTRLFAEHLLAIGIYDEEFLEAASVKAVQTDIRQALSTPDKSGLPFACAVGRGKTSEFTQRSMMDYPEYATVIGDLCDGVRADYATILGLHEECQSRFGRAPEIPELVDPPSWRETAAD